MVFKTKQNAIFFFRVLTKSAYIYAINNSLTKDSIKLSIKVFIKQKTKKSNVCNYNYFSKRLLPLKVLCLIANLFELVQNYRLLTRKSM